MRTGCAVTPSIGCPSCSNGWPKRNASALRAVPSRGRFVRPDNRETLILKFASDRVVAHQALFAHRHGSTTPAFHDELIELWHSSSLRVLVLAFRGGGKSTLVEEALVLAAAMKLVRHVLIIGSNSERANDRLRALKHELATNELLIELFGDLRGPVWNEGRVELSNGVVLQAFGRGQALRGIKHHDVRPDLAFCDDLEEEEHVRTPQARADTLRWFMTELMPALDRNARIRVAATPLNREALPMWLARQSGWVTQVYPVEHVNPRTGQRCATWPARYPLAWIDARKCEFDAAGLSHAFAQEYLCQPEDEANKVFTASMLRIEPSVHSWEATYAFLDPARTVNDRSSATGWAVWSWVGNRLIVWDGGAELWRPDAIISHIFRLASAYAPVVIGVERDGLEEFILQPLRHEQLRRGQLVPIQGHRAPRGKLKFINGLQPFFAAGEITFAKDIPAIKQFLSFPTGKIDFPNALAYAPLMRPGQPIYEDFTRVHVADIDVDSRGGELVFLCLNATAVVTTAVAVQLAGKTLHILADWVREGDPGSALPEIMRDAGMRFGTALRLTAPEQHFRPYQTIGLAPAVRRLPAELARGGDVAKGRTVLRALISQQTQGRPLLQVSPQARWTANGFAAGYARATDPRSAGVPVAEEASEGVYRTLIEGLESALARTLPASGEEEDQRRYAIASDGRRYLTSAPFLAQPAMLTTSKDEWWRGMDEEAHRITMPHRPLRR